ncbi:hypothetical protein FAES_2532 [Fibrella aestuarina BUZ 2]|uniref:Uncharacterized protein n=1 Tax=Fibrella aestuarina BUZ 2 TaxID=1166018 RepID=I0K8T8_9BACT|nr:hypothetical protein [Fibrella aestuarina]CCH00541.1 hypothetical protein FAES_2532 [Fibrella aestuarina BUZ 2]
MERFGVGITRTIDNQQELIFKCAISEDTYKDYSKHYLNISKFFNQQELFQMLAVNYLELNEYFESVLGQFIQKASANMLNDDDGVIYLVSRNSNRLLLNLLSSVRTYLDHTTTYLKRKYPKDSDQVKVFIKKTNELYDNNFEYRFIGKLRNYAQHCGLPMNGIDISIVLSAENKRQLVIAPLFKMNALINDFDEWGSRLKEDFKVINYDLKALKIMAVYYDLMMELNQTVIEIESKALGDSISFLENFKHEYFSAEEIGDSNNTTKCCVLSEIVRGDPNTREITFSAQVYPSLIIEIIKTVL